MHLPRTLKRMNWNVCNVQAISQTKLRSCNSNSASNLLLCLNPLMTREGRERTNAWSHSMKWSGGEVAQRVQYCAYDLIYDIKLFCLTLADSHGKKKITTKKASWQGLPIVSWLCRPMSELDGRLGLVSSLCKIKNSQQDKLLQCTAHLVLKIHYHP